MLACCHLVFYLTFHYYAVNHTFSGSMGTPLCFITAKRWTNVLPASSRRINFVTTKAVWGRLWMSLSSCYSAGPKSVRSGIEPPLIALCCLLLMLVSMPLRIVNHCCSLVSPKAALYLVGTLTFTDTVAGGSLALHHLDSDD